jgi:hypothetical protein
MPSRVEEKIMWLNGQILARHDWLATHGTRAKPWPEHDMDVKRRGLEMMTDIRDDYQLSLDRANQKAAS